MITWLWLSKIYYFNVFHVWTLCWRTWSKEELEKRKERGEDVGVMAQFSAMKSVMGRLQTEMKKESTGSRSSKLKWNQVSSVWNQLMHSIQSVFLPLIQLAPEEQELQQKKHGNAFAAGAAKWAEGAFSPLGSWHCGTN